jgi:amino acid adenylation domain-containing protein
MNAAEVPRQELVEDVYPLSPLQEGMLFHTLASPELRPYFQQVRYTLRGEIEGGLLREAWQRVADRHQPLRAAFVWERRERPLQVIYKRVRLPWSEEDWSGLPEVDWQARLGDLLAQDLARGFELRRAPLLRFTLIRRGGEKLLVWSYHHLILDGWSIALLLEEVAAVYGALVRGAAPELPASAPFAGYIAWLEQQDPAVAESFWRCQLAGLAAPTRLGIERRTGAKREGDEEHREALPAAAAGALRAAARRLGVTLNTFLEAAFALLLGHHGGGEDVLFGAVVSGRQPPLPGIERMVGLLINSQPVRVRLPAAMRLADWLAELAALGAARRRHEHTPLWAVQRCSPLPRDQALFEALLVFENVPGSRGGERAAPVPGCGAGGAGFAGFESSAGFAGFEVVDVESRESTNYPLTLLVQDGGALALRLFCERGRFERAAGARLAGQLRCLLAALAGDLTARVGEVSALAPGERHQLLCEWNAGRDAGWGAERDAGPAMPAAATLLGLVTRQAARTPAAVAVVQGGESWSYGELVRRAWQFARRLRELGVAPEVCVAVALERRPEAMAVILGVLAAGGAYVPLDPAHPAERLRWVLDDCRAPLVVASRRLAPLLPALGEARVWVTDELDGGDGASGDAGAVGAVDENGGGDAWSLEGSAAPDGLAYVMYTSGSTGRPKGVPVAHASAAGLLAAMQERLGASERDAMLAVTALTFDISVLELFLPLAAGGRIVLASAAEAGDATALAGLLRDSGATVMQATPSTWRLLAEVGWPGSPALCALSGGEELPADLARWLAASCGELWNLYGPTETTIWSLAERVEPGAPEVAIGRPLSNSAAFILDGDLRPVPLGAVGELCIGGAGVARGYLGRPDLTAERFVPDALGNRPGGRLYRTGDLSCHLPDGRLRFLGRRDQQLKLRGHRIEPGEIEVALARHPALREAAVVLAAGGSAEPYLTAFLVAEPGDRPASEEIRAHLARILPRTHLPATFTFLPELPLTPHRKLDRAALQRAAVSGTAALASRPALGVAPRDVLELQLLWIWEELLPARPISVKAGFFDLGGHSLLGVRLVARIRKELGLELPLAALLQNPSVEQLAGMLRAGVPPKASPLVRIAAGCAKPPLVCVHAAGGHALCYRPLAQHLGARRPVLGLEAIGLHGGEEPVGDMAEIARRYVAALCEEQPEGPYHLLGWSFGGLVAYEMACQLAEAGRPVGLLALLDTAAPEPCAVPSESEAMLQWAQIAGLDVEPAELAAAGGFGERLGLLLERMKRRDLIPPDITFEQGRCYFRVSRALREAMCRYVPGPYPGRIDLFRVAAAPGEERADSERGWGPLAEGGVAVHEVPGEHDDLIYEPHVKVLAERLRQRLEEADAPGASASA